MTTKINFNELQKKAIYEHINNNVIVSAAAGSGKTKVLTERVVNFLLDENNDYSLSNMLIMTFTRKATQELKERIKLRLDEKIKENKNNSKILNEISLIQNARINTIDAFCKRILDENYTYLNDENSLYGNFDPSYRVVDNSELNMVYDDVLDTFLEKKYCDEKYTKFFNLYFEKDDKKLKELLLDAILKCSNILWATDFLKEKIENFYEDSKKINEEYYENIKKELIGHKKIISRMKKIANISIKALTTNNKTNIKTYDVVCNLKKELEKYIELIDNVDDENIKKKVKDINIDSLIFPRKNNMYIDENLQEEYSQIRDLFNSKNSIKIVIKEFISFISLPDEILINENEKFFLSLLLELYQEITKEKISKNILSMNDIQHLCLDILYDKQIDENNKVKRVISNRAIEIGSELKFIFVDEYQDTNEIQEKILYAITNGFDTKNVFMVGDPKQCIYRFRNAEPEIFINKYKSFKNNNKNGVSLLLNENYRSSNNILTFVNLLFENIMNEKLSGIDYKNDGMLYFPKDKEDDILDKVDIKIITSDEKDEKAEIENYNIRLEAKYIAKQIKEIIGKGKYSYKDIVILSRSIKTEGNILIEELAKENIPSHATSKIGFYNRQEIKLMINILKIIDNPMQDIPITAILMSNIFNINNNELLTIKKIYEKEIVFGKNENYVLYEAIKFFIESFEKIKNKSYVVDINNLYKKLVDFYEKLNDLIFKARFLSVSELIDNIYIIYDIKNIMLSKSEGKLRIANLDLLYQNAKNYENSSFVGLFSFLRYIERTLEQKEDIGQAVFFNENDNIVRIMNIHNSKGMEFPVVIFSRITKKINYASVRSDNSFFFNKKIGFALKYINKELNYEIPTPKYLSMKKNIFKEIISEEINLLYVAFTRAKEKLIITGYVSKADDLAIPNFKKINDEQLNDANSLFDFINMISSSNDCYNFETISESYNATKNNIKIEQFKNIDDIFSYLPTENHKEFIENKQKEINSNLDFKYKYEPLQNMKVKYSASSLMDENTVDIKEFNEMISNNEDSINAIEIGNTYHKFLQTYDFTNNIIENEILKKDKIEKFLNSEVGKLMKEAFGKGMLMREQKFMQLVSYDYINKYLQNEKVDNIDEIYNGLNKENLITIQGVIDAFFFVENKNGEKEIVLVDYKTNKINSGDKLNIDDFKNSMLKKYKMQLDIYENVIKELTGYNVIKKYLYLFAIDEAVEV